MLVMSSVSRRNVLGAGAGAVAGLGLAAHMAALGRGTSSEAARPQSSGQSLSPFGAHQAGVDTPVAAAHELIAFTLHDDVDRAALGRMMRVCSTDIAALMQGRPAAGDTLPDMAQPNVSMSVLVGFGPGFFDVDGLRSELPAGMQEIPPMQHDALQPEWTGGDLLLWISADDFTSVTYAKRCLTRDVAPWASVRWAQQGFWRGTDAQGQPVTGRNLFGQIDGTANATGASFDGTLWSTDGWLAGGTQLVVRRIAMDLPEWDKLTRHQMEKVMGRRLDSGAPLSGGTESTPLDLMAVNPADGQPAIPLDAHARLAHPSENNGRRMHRRGINYSDHTGTGLIFNAFQANIAKQFIPVQRALDDADALNQWTTAVGSAVFAIPRGMVEGGWIGQELLA